MAEPEKLVAPTAATWARMQRAIRWVEMMMRSRGFDPDDLPGNFDFDREQIPAANYVRVTGDPAVGDDTTNGIYPGQFVSLDGAEGTGPWSDYDPVQFCYVRDLTGAPLIASTAATAGPIYKGNVYANHGTGALVLVGGGGCTGGTSPTGADCDVNCAHTLIFDTCNGEIVTHNTLIMNFGVPAKFCLSQSTSPAPPCPTGPTGPMGQGIKKELRNLPIVVGQSIEIGATTLGSILDVSINGGTAFQMSKIYNVSHRYDAADPTNWYEVRPLSAPQPYGTGHDFTLDVKRNGSEQTYRVRRVAGTTAATASVDIYTGGSFTGSSGTGATAAVGYIPQTVLTQTNGCVSIGKLNTDAPIFLLDLGTQGVVGTGGIALNTDSSNVGPRIIRWRRLASDRFDLAYDGTTDILYVSGSSLHSWWGRTTGFNSTSVIVDSNGGVNPVKMSQLISAAGVGVVAFQPTTGNSISVLEVLPSGTQTAAQLLLHNTSLRLNSGQIALTVIGATGYLSAASVGTGSAPTMFRDEIPTLFAAGVTFASTALFSSTTVMNGTVNINNNLTCTASASFLAPVLFGTGGTATFWDRAAFKNSITVLTPGYANDVLIQGVGGFTSSELSLRPTSGNAWMALDLTPSGTQDQCHIAWNNNEDWNNTGAMRMMLDGPTGYMESVSTGTGAAPTLFQWSIPLSVGSPTTFTSSGTATFSSRAIFNNSLTLLSAGGTTPMLLTQSAPSASSPILQVQPSTAGAANPTIAIKPSGTGVSSAIQMYNASDGANAGTFQIHTSSIVELSSFAGGTGVAPSRIDAKFPVNFTSTGTATFVSSIHLDSSGGVAVLRLDHKPSFGSSLLALQPASGNNESHLNLLPSGTEDRTVLGLSNSSNSAISGLFRLSVQGATASIEGITSGTGTAVDLLNIGMKTQFTDHIGFYNGAPIAKPTVTGSRGGNAALASLLTALANLNLITDSTSA